MTGGAVFDGSFAALAPFGRLVTYGLAGRKRPRPIQATDLMATSRAVIGFWLIQALRRPGGLGPAMEELLSLASSGGLPRRGRRALPARPGPAGPRGHPVAADDRQAGARRPPLSPAG